jgi:hypothetical protein
MLIRGTPRIELRGRIRMARERRAWYADSRRPARLLEHREALEMVQRLRAAVDIRQAFRGDLSMAA